MKNIILSNTIFFFSFFSFLNAQSNIGITIGMDFTETKSEDLSFPIHILEKGYQSRGYLFGFRFEQKISKSFFLSINGDYAKKRITAVDAGVVPFDTIAFSKFRTSLSVNCMPFPFLSIGAGPSGIYSPKIESFYLGDLQYIVEGKRKEIGGLFSINAFYRRVMVEINYYHGLKTLGTYKSVLKPLNSINLSLHYLFKLGHKKQGGPKNKSRF